jgi:uncharacterized protein (TIGR02466 family)
MSTFLSGIFATPLLIGNSHDIDIREKICALALQFRENAHDAKLVSEGWNYGRSSSSQEDFNQYGVTSFSSQSLLDDPDWKDVMTFLYDFANAMIASVNNTTGVMSFVNSWVTIYPPGTYIPEHIHSNSMLSGVFYAKVPEKAGNLLFKDPSAVAKTMYTRHYNDFPTVPTIHTHVVEEGQMIIFPSWLPHMTEINKSQDNRIMVSFNINMIDPE